MNLPEEAVQHPVVEEMTILAIDMIILDNVSRATFSAASDADRSIVGSRTSFHTMLSRLEVTTGTTSSHLSCINTTPTPKVP
jgi:hypothetical protein